MTKKTKRALFYSTVVIFSLLSYVVILYAQGYKYSFSELKFFQTGAIYVKANEDVKVYLDDKFLNSTSFFGNSYTLKGLLPREHTVRLQKDNFSSWEKKVSVQEGLVSEYSSVLLLPESGDAKENLKIEIKTILTSTTGSTSSSQATSEEPFYIKNGTLNRNVDGTIEKLAYLVSGFDVSPDDKKLTWWNGNELWVMWLSDTDYQPYHKAGDKDLLTRFSTKIKNAAWFRDSDHIVVDPNGYKVVEIDKRGGLNIVEVN